MRGANARPSCGRSPRPRAMSGASRCVSPRPSRHGRGAGGSNHPHAVQRRGDRKEGREPGPRNRRRKPARSRHRRDPQGQFRLRRRPHQGLAPRGPEARDRLRLPCELRRGHGLRRRGPHLARRRDRSFRPRGRDRRRHSRFRDARFISPRRCLRNAAPRRSRLAFSSTSKCRARRRSCPTSSGSSVRRVFVVGYGMDLAHCYRELPFIGEMAKP